MVMAVALAKERGTEFLPPNCDMRECSGGGRPARYASSPPIYRNQGPSFQRHKGESQGYKRCFKVNLRDPFPCVTSAIHDARLIFISQLRRNLYGPKREGGPKGHRPAAPCTTHKPECRRRRLCPRKAVSSKEGRRLL